ncbi:MAG: hypothetical protein GX315_02760 [Spirochaetales bacterium]|jgi:hypothetical protein|nr:hypothetical protein [Spirochaetales bacterium]
MINYVIGVSALVFLIYRAVKSLKRRQRIKAGRAYFSACSGCCSDCTSHCSG